MLTDICCQTDAFTHCIFTVVSIRLYTQKKDLSAALTQDLPSWVRWVGKSSPEGGRWARLGFDPSFYKGKQNLNFLSFCLMFCWNYHCCLQDRGEAQRGWKQKITCLFFPNAIFNFFSQNRNVSIDILFIIFFGGLERVGHFFCSRCPSRIFEGCLNSNWECTAVASEY